MKAYSLLIALALISSASHGESLAEQKAQSKASQPCAVATTSGKLDRKSADQIDRMLGSVAAKKKEEKKSKGIK